MIMGSNYRSGVPKKPNETVRLTCTTILGIIIGFLVGVSFPSFSAYRINLLPNLSSTVDLAFIDESISLRNNLPLVRKPVIKRNTSSGSNGSGDSLKIYVETNPRGAELLPPDIIVPETDFYLRRLWGDPEEDLTIRQKYLVTFTVGFDQSQNIDMAVKKFPEDCTILLFHYDGRASEWEQFEWSNRAIHVSVKAQSKWWCAKRFLHPDVVAAYEYIFIWDEDLDLEHFNPKKYIELVRKHGLEISQPALESSKGLIWQMTKRRAKSKVHKETLEKPGWCTDPHLPPCAAFVEVMAPVFSKDAWRCVWHMIQNDLIHGWGLDFAFRRCVEPAHEKIGVVDSQWIVHKAIPLLGSQVVESEGGKAKWQMVRDRGKFEWSQFLARLTNADKAYFAGTQKG